MNIVTCSFSSWTCTYLKDFCRTDGPVSNAYPRGRILSLSHFCFTDLHLFKGSCLVNVFVNNLHPSLVARAVCTKTSKGKLVYWSQERTNSSNTFTGGISSSFRCSMGEGASVRLEFPGGSCLVRSSGQPFRVLPTWALAFLGLDLLLLLKLCAGRGLLYQAILASLSYCSIRPSSVGILPFCWRHSLLLRPGSLG